MMAAFPFFFSRKSAGRGGVRQGGGMFGHRSHAQPRVNMLARALSSFQTDRETHADLGSWLTERHRICLRHCAGRALRRGKSAAGETGFGLRGGFPGNVRHSEVFAWTPPRVGARDSVRSHAHGLLRVHARVARHAHALHHPPRAHPHVHAKPARTHALHAHD